MPIESDDHLSDEDKQRLCGERCLDLARDMIQQFLTAPVRWNGIKGEVVYQDETYDYQFIFKKRPIENDDDTPTDIKSNPDSSPPA